MPPGAAEASACFVAASSFRDRYLLRLLEIGWFRALILLRERFALPGISLHYVLRKRRLEEIARDSLEAGFAQIIVLGAGFDTLALRLHEAFPRASFIEIDHPATQQVKREVLRGRGPLRGNLHLLAADLARQEMKHTLAACPGYRPGTDTLFIAEGLLMYLNEEQVETLFRSLREQSTGRGRFAFTFLEPQTGGQPGFPHAGRYVDWWLRRRGEPFQWAVKRDDLAGFVSGQGFTLREMIAADTLRHRYLPDDDARRINGDLIGLAEIAPPPQ